MLTVLFSRTKYKLKPSKGNVEACAASNSAPGPEALDPLLAKLVMCVSKEAPRAALGTLYSKLSGTMKIGEIGLGKGRR